MRKQCVPGPLPAFGRGLGTRLCRTLYRRLGRRGVYSNLSSYKLYATCTKGEIVSVATNGKSICYEVLPFVFDLTL